MPEYTVTGRGHFVRADNGDLLESEVGSIVELSEREAAGLADRLTLVEAAKEPAGKVFTTGGGGESVQSAAGKEPTDKKPPFEMEGKTIEEVLAAVAAGDVSAEYALEWEERQDKPRKGVLDALKGD